MLQGIDFLSGEQNERSKKTPSQKGEADFEVSTPKEFKGTKDIKKNNKKEKKKHKNEVSWWHKLFKGESKNNKKFV